MAPKAAEPINHPNDPLPPGYRFLRKGNVYLTANCRRLTQAASKTIYVVLDQRKKQLGIRIPGNIFAQVTSTERDTQEKRAQAVDRQDNAAAQEFRTALLKHFPKAPKNVVPQVVNSNSKRKALAENYKTIFNKNIENDH